MITARLLKLGRRPYTETLELMRALATGKTDPDAPDVLILVEHNPVMTMGRRSKETDLLLPEDEYARRGIEVHRIERGGLITYHGPGQAVAYPVFLLRRHGLGVADFVRALEDIILAVLSDYGLDGRRRPGHPGVWVGPDKIASIGLAVRRGVTFHGLSLNADPDLNHFGLINPCGLNPAGITTMRRLLGRRPDLDEVQNRLAEHFAQKFNIKFEDFSPAEARAVLGASQAEGRNP